MHLCFPLHRLLCLVFPALLQRWGTPSPPIPSRCANHTLLQAHSYMLPVAGIAVRLPSPPPPPPHLQATVCGPECAAVLGPLAQRPPRSEDTFLVTTLYPTTPPPPRSGDRGYRPLDIGGYLQLESSQVVQWCGFWTKHGESWRKWLTNQRARSEFLFGERCILDEVLFFFDFSILVSLGL